MDSNRTGCKGNGEQGQALVLVALAFIPILMMVGLVVDLGLLYMSKAQLQRAVDAAALSASETFYTPGVDATEKAAQFLASNLIGVPPSTLTCSVTVGTPPDTNQLTVSATRRVNTLIMSIVPALSTVTVGAQATAVLDSFAEVPLHPDLNSAQPGKTGMVNPSVFGPGAKYDYGDAYSPDNLPSGATNPDHSRQPYGYLFRISVPPNYITSTGSSHLKIELFDPDCYNMDVPHYLDPPTNHVVNPDYDSGHTNRADAYIKLDYYGPGWHKYFRVDEIRSPSPAGSPTWDTAYVTTTQYTLWHFRTDLVNLNPFADPATLSDLPGGAYVARATYGNDSSTDLKWVAPPGFTVNLSSFPQETSENGGGWSFYLYVQSISGSSENGFDIRSGPPGQDEEADANDQQNHSWNTGGTMIFARRSYPWNNNASANFTVYLTQVPESAAGTTLLVRHFDNDYDQHTIPYYLQDPSGTDWSVATGQQSGNGVWWSSDPSYSGGDRIQIPARGTSLYNQIFPPGVKTAWLKARYDEAIAQDSSVWELLYIRPRLLK